jgi:drug/metabolite transporter (DMT)-like permease
MAAKPRAVALTGLIAGATVWGLVWYPYRILAEAGIGGVLSATLTYAVALALAFPLLWRHLRAFRPSWSLLVIALAAGGCNLGYVLATLHGEVMRVLLLFYLAPLWTVLLARVLLKEELSTVGFVVVGLSFAGAMVMLFRPDTGVPLPRNGAEWAGLVAGFLFALSNVLIRKTAPLSIEVKSMVVFAGVVAIGVVLLAMQGVGTQFEGAFAVQPMLTVVVVGITLLAINLAVQFGLTHVPANQAIVIFLFELVVAALSSWLLAGEELGTREWLGGAMIVAASVFSARLGKGDAASREAAGAWTVDALRRRPHGPNRGSGIRVRSSSAPLARWASSPSSDTRRRRW